MTTEVETAFNAQLGRNITARRKLMRVSACKLGRKVSAHRNTIKRWEQGGGVPFWHLLRIADALSCNWLTLVPAREFVWGDAPRVYLPPKKPVQQERDGRLSAAQLRDEGMTA